MELYGLSPCREVGLIKSAIKDAILDGIIQNDHDQAFQYMLKIGKEMGLSPISNQ
jgi:poly(A) polymerase